MQTTIRRFAISLGMISLVAFSLLALSSPVAWADDTNKTSAQTGTSGVTSDAAPGLPLPLGNATPESLIGRVIRTALGFTGVLALVMFIYGGITWMTAGGNSDRVGSAKKTLIWATIGLLAVFAAYSLVSFITKTLG